MGFENMENYIIFPLNTVNVVSMKQNTKPYRENGLIPAYWNTIYSEPRVHRLFIILNLSSR